MKINLIEIQTKIRSLIFKFKGKMLSFNNLLVISAFLMAVFWAWGSISAMAQNHTLQQELERKKRDEKISKIQRETLQFEQNYLKSAEYQELAAREKLGLVMEGEHVLILPDYPEEEKTVSKAVKKRSNFAEWMNFLFGGNAKKIEN